jgi:hypothetical protein
MEKFGTAPKIDGDRYEEAISATQRTFQALHQSKTRSATQSK